MSDQVEALNAAPGNIAVDLIAGGAGGILQIVVGMPLDCLKVCLRLWKVRATSNDSLPFSDPSSNSSERAIQRNYGHPSSDGQKGRRSGAVQR